MAVQCVESQISCNMPVGRYLNKRHMWLACAWGGNTRLHNCEIPDAPNPTQIQTFTFQPQTEDSRLLWAPFAARCVQASYVQGYFQSACRIWSLIRGV